MTWAERRHRAVIAAAVLAGRLVRLCRLLFAPAAAAAVSAGLGELAGHIFGRGLAPWVALVIAGGFGLQLARELNRVRPPPPRHDED